MQLAMSPSILVGIFHGLDMFDNLTLSNQVVKRNAICVFNVVVTVPGISFALKNRFLF